MIHWKTCTKNTAETPSAPMKAKGMLQEKNNTTVITALFNSVTAGLYQLLENDVFSLLVADLRKTS